jgi:predicted type IV restriction endonuclease
MPGMTTIEEALINIVRQVQARLKTGQFVNEAAVSQGAVLPILNALGWPVFDAQIVCPEYTVEGRRVDFALCHQVRRPEVFIEVKQVGRSDGADRQLFEYAFHTGVPLALLTTGQEWHFYLPAGQGTYQERRVYRLDLLEREPEECAGRLIRYLSSERVAAGDALTAAREDYQGLARIREIQETLPIAWERLIEEQDEQLVELIGTRVEEICGYKPDPETVASFLEGQARPNIRVPQNPPLARRLSPSPVISSPTPTADVTRIGYVLDGQEFQARYATDVLINVLEKLSSRDPGFLERFAGRRHGRKNRWVAKTADELYPGGSDQSRAYSRQLSSGWWASTIHGRRGIRKILQMASEVAGLQFGTELIVYLG